MSTTTEDDDLDSGFASDPTAGRSVDPDETPAPEPQAQEDGKPEGETVAEEAAAPDPLEGLPQPVKDLLADYQRTKLELEQIKRHAGQVPALQARIDKFLAHQAPADKPAPEPPRFAKVAKLRDEGLPEIADALEELASALPKPPEPAAAEQVADKTPTANAAVDAQLEVLEEVRPGWADLVFGNPFQLWLSTQPPEYATDVRGTSKAKVILSAIAKFEQQQARTQATQQASDARTRRMAAAVTPRGDGRTLVRQTTEDDEDADLEAGFKR